MTGSRANLEIRYRWILVVIVLLFGAVLAAGLSAYMLNQASGVSRLALNSGLILLMASPAVRMMVATAERIRLRDWTFLAMTAVVALELSLVMWRAVSR